MAIGDALQETLYLRQLLSEFGPQYITGPTTIFNDNQGAVKIGQEVAFHRRTRHIDAREHSIREHVQRGTITLQYLPTNEMIADMLTKPLTGRILQQSRASAIGETGPNQTRGHHQSGKAPH